MRLKAQSLLQASPSRVHAAVTLGGLVAGYWIAVGPAGRPCRTGLLAFPGSRRCGSRRCES
jgi:hypothetical protein